jgi:hypothetical protein
VIRNGSRRAFLQSLLGAGAGLAPLACLEAAPPRKSSDARDRLLDEIESRACRFFYDLADPDTGLVLDRAALHQSYVPGVASIAATGFGLSALCIADQRRYVDSRAAKERVRRTLEFLNSKSRHEHGFFYHFVDSSSGARVWSSEVSSIDTAWLLCGVLHCRAHWDDPEIRRLASDLLNRVDWPWMLNSGQMLSHGWTPEHGFLRYRWDSYAETLAMYLLAIGAESNSIPASCWDVWKRPMRDFDGIFFIDSATPIFVHQYSHAWFDFRDRRDRYANYFHNSQRATEAHRLYCMGLSGKFPWYGPDMWGVTASDSRGGYRAWASPSDLPDGTLVPCAAGGSIVFLPDRCGAVLENMVERYGAQVWSKYGFIDAFQPDAGWFSRYVIGINLGIMLLMAENSRSGAVWNAVMSTPEAGRAMDAVGLRPI